MKTTAQIIAECREPSEPQDTILDFLRTINGKKINKRHVRKLKELTGHNVGLDKQCGMTTIYWGNYKVTQGREGGELLLAHSDKNVVVDVDFILKKNPAYFSAKDERNAQRRDLLENHQDDLKEIDAAVKGFYQAKERLDRALNALPVDYVNVKVNFQLM